MAACIVQRPSPESETRPAKSASVGPRAAPAVRSSSHEAMTLPRRHTSETGEVKIVLVVLGVSSGVVSASTSRCCAAGVGVLEDVQALGVGGHDAVLDAVVDHLHEVACAVRPAVEVAVLRGAPGRPSARRPGRGAMPGASVAKIGSSRATASSPPIIRQ